MTEGTVYNTKRFKYVVYYCPYLYYDSKDNVYRCAEHISKISKSGRNMCGKCRHPGLSEFISDDYKIDLSDLNG